MKDSEKTELALRALYLFQNEKEEEAFALLLQAAEEGDTAAQWMLGNCYLAGKGTTVNQEKGVEWFKLSAAQGDAKAQYALGHLYAFGIEVEQSLQKAAHLFIQAAKQGHEDAKKALGSLLLATESITDAEHNEHALTLNLSFVIEDGILKKYTGHEALVIIPEGVSQIALDAFDDCSTIIKIIIPNSVHFIGRYTFQKCRNLKEAVLPKACKYYRRGDCYYDEYESGDYEDYPARLYCGHDDTSFPLGCKITGYRYHIPFTDTYVV